MSASTLMSASTSKRRVSDGDSQPNEVIAKKQKVHPFFTKSNDSANDTTKPSSSFQWHAAFGPKRTCLHGTNLAPQIAYSPKIAAFDLDGTLIESTYGKGAKGKATAGRKAPATFSSSSSPSEAVFNWWNGCVPGKLEEVHKDGYSIVIISNQAIGSKKLEAWKKKAGAIADALPAVPFRFLAATAKDGYRKPMPGMWYILEEVYRKEGVEIDKESSFFVGDAAGRSQDFAGTDRKWALNVGIPFFTPEEYFLGKPSTPFSLTGFNVSSLKEASPLIPVLSTKPEIVLFVGYPCLGKSSFYRKYFEPAGYVHINQDTLGTRPKCVKAAEEALTSGHSCVIDNTNRDCQTRRYYIELGNKIGVPVRCFKFEGSMQLAWHNNLYRAFNSASPEPKREMLPYMAFTSFQSNYEDPQKLEGFSDIMAVNWVFEGREEEKRRWEMWHQIDGK